MGWAPTFGVVAPKNIGAPALQPAFFSWCGSGDGVSLKLFFAGLPGWIFAGVFADL